MKSSRFILTAMLAAALTGGVMTATDSMADPTSTIPVTAATAAPVDTDPAMDGTEALP